MLRHRWHLGIALLLLALPGCKKGTSGGKAGSPEALGRAIGQAYRDAFHELAGLVRGHPEAARVTPKVEALRARVIRRMVELGRQRQVLSAADRRQVDAATRVGVSSVERGDWRQVATAATFYRGKSATLANTLAGFNVITQYAAFELLKKQRPAEARRLGIP